MFNSLLNWRTVLAVIAIAIVTGTVFYSNHLAKKIAAEEKIKVEQWVEATKDILNPNSQPAFASIFPPSPPHEFTHSK